jgi:Glucodextranase, domain B
MFRDAKTIVKGGVGVLLALTIVTYSYLEARKLIAGPIITVATPKNGQTVNNDVVTIEGTAKNTARLTLNDLPILTDERGRFSEKLLLPDGYTILTLEARDKFGKKTRKSLELVYKQQ